MELRNENPQGPKSSDETSEVFGKRTPWFHSLGGLYYTEQWCLSGGWLLSCRRYGARVFNPEQLGESAL